MTTNGATIDVNAPSFAPSENVELGSPPKKTNPDPRADVARSDSNTDDSFDWQKIDSLTFAFRMGLTLLILVFCLNKLNTADPGKESPVYWGAITGLIGWWMPSPGNGKPTAKPDAK